MITDKVISMTEYLINYGISKRAKIAVVILTLIFSTGVVIKFISLWLKPDILDVVLLALFVCFLVFSFTAIWAFLIKKQAVIAISNRYILVSVPYFFKIRKIKIQLVREIKISTWSRSEIVYQDGMRLKNAVFLAAFLGTEDRDSFLANIFDLIPNVQIK